MLPILTPYSLHVGDVIETLKSIPDGSIELSIMDPAYESLEKHRNKGTTTRLKQSKSSSNEWFAIFPNSRFEEFFKELYRAHKKNSHAYIICDGDTMFVAKPIAEAAGFKFWKHLTWDKMAIGLGYHYRNKCEYILFLEKGKRKLNDLSVSDLLSHKRVRNGYPTEKPVSLLEVLVKQSSIEGETVVDLFCGSGSAGVAAIRNNRKFFGGDIKQDAVDITKSRLDAVLELREDLT